MNRYAGAFLILLFVACTGDGGDPVGPSPDDAPIVELSVGFGDPPVTGVVRIRAGNDSESWAYAVDLNSDGVADATGEVADGADVPFRFDTPGIHRIEVDLTLEGARHRTEWIVVVNNPAVAEAVQFAVIPPGNEPGSSPEGITVGQGPAGLELYVSMAFAKRVFRLDPGTLEVVTEASLGSLGTNTLEGLDLDPDGDRLYVVAKSRHLIMLNALDLTVEEVFDRIDGAAFTVHATAPGIVITGGEGRITRLDAEDGTVLAARLLTGAEIFSVRPDQLVVGLIQREGDQRRIRFLDAMSFQDLASTTLPPDFSPHSLAFKPDGSLLYVMGLDVAGRVRFVAVDADSGELVVDQRLDPCDSFCFFYSIASPAAASHDGRFVVFPSLNGAYVVDTALDLTRYRISGEQGCCTVAASPSENVFYFAQSLEFDATSVTAFRLDP